MKAIDTISPLIGITLSSIIVYYLKNLETIGCECAMNEKRTYIFVYSSVVIAFNAFVLLYGGVDNLVKFYNKFPLTWAFPIIIAIAGIVNIVYTLQYIEDMKKLNCKCSKSPYRDMMYVLAIINAVSLGLTLVTGVFVGFLFAKALRK